MPSITPLNPTTLTNILDIDLLHKRRDAIVLLTEQISKWHSAIDAVIRHDLLETRQRMRHQFRHVEVGVER